MNRNFSNIIKPATKKPYVLPKEEDRLMLDGLSGSKRYMLPDEKESKLKSSLRALFNIIRYGNSVGMPRLATDNTRKHLAQFCAITAVFAAASYGAYKNADVISNSWRHRQGMAAYKRYMKHVPVDQRDDAEAYFNTTNDVKMVDYYLSDPVRIRGAYKSALLEYYDKDNDGVADIVVGTKVDPELFSSYAEGDVANEVHGSWARYAHPMKKLAIETSREEGIIMDLSTKRFVNFKSSGKNTGNDI